MQFQLNPDLKSNLDLMTTITRDNGQVTLLLVENQGTEDGINPIYLPRSSQVLI